MALTTQAGYRAAMNVNASTPSDAEITVALGQAESFVAEVLDRRIETAGSDATDILDGSGFETIQLRAWPLVSVTSVSYLSSVAAGAGSYTAFDTGSYMDDATGGRLIRTGFVDYGFENTGDATWPEGNQNIKVVSQGGYTSSTVPDVWERCIYELAASFMQTRDGNTEDVRGQTEDMRGLVMSMIGGEVRQMP